MKLSDAIALGAMLRPQIRTGYFNLIGTCALGAALDAVGKLEKQPDSHGQRVVKIWPWLVWPLKLKSYKRKPEPGEIGCSCGRNIARNMSDLVIHMNDFHKTSREEIAGFVAGVERLLSEQLQKQGASADPTYKLSHFEAQLQEEQKSPTKKKIKQKKEKCLPVG